MNGIFPGDKMPFLTDFDQLNSLARGKNIYIYGAGGGGLGLLRNIQANIGHLPIKAFLDTYKSGTLADLDIIPFERYRHNPNQNYILIASHSWQEIETMLHEQNILDFSSAPPFWVDKYMFSPKDINDMKEEIEKVNNMFTDQSDQWLFRHLVHARTHGSPLAELRRNENTEAITL